MNLCYELVFHGFIHVNAEEALLVVTSLKDDDSLQCYMPDISCCCCVALDSVALWNFGSKVSDTDGPGTANVSRNTNNTKLALNASSQPGY